MNNKNALQSVSLACLGGISFYTKQDFLAKSFSLPTLSKVEYSSVWIELIEYARISMCNQMVTSEIRE